MCDYKKEFGSRLDKLVEEYTSLDLTTTEILTELFSCISTILLHEKLDIDKKNIEDLADKKVVNLELQTIFDSSGVKETIASSKVIYNE